MVRSRAYYNSLPECSIIDYEIIPLPEAALLWCGIKFEDLAYDVKILQHLSESIYRHPYIPCLEKKTRVLNQAVNSGRLRAVREHGRGGEDGDHVAYLRRHFWISDLKQFIADNYPNDRPKTIFNDDELKAIIDLPEYKRMSNEYQKILAENTNIQTKINTLETNLANKDSVIRDQELAIQSLAIQLQQAKTAQNDAEERLTFARDCYAKQRNTIKQLENKLENTSEISINNILYLLGEMLSVVTKSDPKKWTQSSIIDKILTNRMNLPVKGLEQRKIEEYFSLANKTIKSQQINAE
ncbi:hypothetical protein EV694_0292 [Volucribacter psittacicida]|uniref:Uncharacterized protein n=1 Tax=Volucribacter psittacicida TaxID=203482 RepID=A0A4R1GBM7_9PAST|nr:hypothetical protein [Volucribacter psittacicida]TCK01672.1 hypothetical protein EV694_0292 [Volucribacter psittacicida]